MTEEELKDKPGRVEQGLYSYETSAEADEARTEAERIRRLEKQLDYTKPALVLAFYKKALEGHVFRTAEGYSYLVHLRTYLEERREDLGGVIPCIPADYMSERSEYRMLVSQLKDSLKSDK